jgi:O-antigen/teichoic acid export membrane protein
VFSQTIITLLFSAKYRDSAPGFALLMIAFQMTFMVNLMGFTLTAAKHPGLSFLANLLRTGTHIVADLILIPILGFLGPTIAANVSAYLNNPANVFLLRRVGIRVASLPYVKQTALLLALSVVYWLWQPQSFVLRVAIVVAFVGLNLLLSTISFEDFSLIVPERYLQRLRRNRAPAGEVMASGR